MVLRATLPIDKRKRASVPTVEAVPRHASKPAGTTLYSVSRTALDSNIADVTRALRALHLLLRSAKLYERQHPRILQSLDAAYESLRGISAQLNGLEIHVERGGLLVPKLSETPLPDARGDLYALARDLQRAGIYNLAFAPKFHVGELDTLAQLDRKSVV